MFPSYPDDSKNSESSPGPRTASEADCFKADPTLKLRPVDEWNCMLVYTPVKPGIHYLNPLAWVVFELCDGSSRAAIRSAYLELNQNRMPEDEALRRLDSALDQLTGDSLVIQTSSGL